MGLARHIIDDGTTELGWTIFRIIWYRRTKVMLKWHFEGLGLYHGVLKESEVTCGVVARCCKELVCGLGKQGSATLRGEARPDTSVDILRVATPPKD